MVELIINYFASRGINVVRANNIDITIVALNSIFSTPRRVLKPELNPSPPNAAPSPALERCMSIATINSTERATWIYGNIPIIVSIACKSNIR